MTRTRNEWQKLVDGWAASGLTCAEYAATVGVAPQSLSAWKSKLKQAKVASTVSAGRVAAVPAFVEVTAPARAVATAAPGELELRVGGVTICVRGRVDPSALGNVLDVLEGRR